MSDRERALLYCLFAVIAIAIIKYMQWNEVVGPR